MHVVSVTPAGRRRYMQILVQHLLRQRHVIHEHHWWLNTDVPEDIAFLRDTCLEYPDFFRICKKPFNPARTHGDNIWKFFKDFAEPGTLYVRLDDDIVWLADDAIERLVRYRQEHRTPPLVLGNIVNNAVCSAAHQQAGLISAKWGVAEPVCEDWVGWRNGRFARLAHDSLLADLDAGREALWKRVPVPISCGQRFSINVISWFGETLAALPEIGQDELDEEPFLTERLTKRLGRANAVCSEALFAHFAFYPQRWYMDWTSRDLLERYTALAQQRPPRSDRINTFWRDEMTWRLTKPYRKIRRSILKRMGKSVAA